MGILKIGGGIFFSIFISVSCFGQKPSDFELLKKKYPGEKAVIFNDQLDVLIEANNDSYKTTETAIKETYLLQNAGKEYATDQVNSSHFVKVKEIDAKTFVPDGDKFSVKKVEKFVASQNHPDYVFYDEEITKSFVFPSIQPGAITYLKFVRELSNPIMMGSFFFKWHVPCEISKICVKVDKRANLKYKLYNVDPLSLDFTQQEKGKYITYTWTVKNIKSAFYESDGPNLRYYYPHIVYYIENSNPLDTVSKDFKGLNALYHYYYNLVKDVNVQDDAKIREEVEKVTAGANSEEEKVKRIFYWIQDNINYIAFEEGMQGLVPENASLVFSKRYGDCKGMSSLMNTMLKMAGAKSYLTWIGTRHLPYKYTDIPTSIVDNHMIVTYYSNGRPIFLDGTNGHLSFGMPSSMIQGKQALVAVDEKNYKIEEVPIMAGSQNVSADSACFTIHNNSIQGSGVLTLTGYDKNNKTYYLTGRDKIKLKEDVLAIVSKGNNKFFLDTFSIRNLDNREAPLNIGYKFRINDYFREIDGDVYINMSLNKPFYNVTYDSVKRPVPVEGEYFRALKYTSVFEIPDGYQISLLPKDKSGSFEKLSFTVHYKVEEKKVIQVNEIRTNYLILEPGEFGKWNEVVESLNKAYRDILILKKIKN